MNEIIVDISGEFFLSTLNFPEGTEYRGQLMADKPGNIRIVVSHPDVPEKKEGEAFPMAVPYFVRHECEACLNGEIEFIDWGIR